MHRYHGAGSGLALSCVASPVAVSHAAFGCAAVPCPLEVRGPQASLHPGWHCVSGSTSTPSLRLIDPRHSPRRGSSPPTCGSLQRLSGDEMLACAKLRGHHRDGRSRPGGLAAVSGVSCSRDGRSPGGKGSPRRHEMGVTVLPACGGIPIALASRPSPRELVSISILLRPWSKEPSRHVASMMRKGGR